MTTVKGKYVTGVPCGKYVEYAREESIYTGIALAEFLGIWDIM